MFAHFDVNLTSFCFCGKISATINFSFPFTAFTSWICYYKTFSKELRHIFQLREIHMGHIASNFGLRDAPKDIVKNHSKGDDVKKERNKNFDFNHRVYVPRGDQRSFNKLKRKYGDFSKTNFAKSSAISEFDSGLPEIKKSKRS